jgi:hypothetical protein
MGIDVFDLSCRDFFLVILRLYLLIAEKRALAPNLRLLELAKVSHENLTLK